MPYWLAKTEPSTFSIDDLKRNRVTHWEGVRNYQARNNLMSMKLKDRVLIYHSACAEPAVVGIGVVVKRAYPDHFAFDPGSKYFDPKSSPEKPRWFMPDIEFVEKFEDPVPLKLIREQRGLSKMVLVNNSRLSVQPVTAAQFRAVCKLAGNTG